MKEHSLRRNYVMNAILSLSGVIFPLIDFKYATGILQPEGVGKVTVATSVIAYFMMLASLGIPTYGVRACAAVRDDRQKLSKTVHELLGISLVMDLVAYVLLAVALFFVPKFAQERTLYIVMSASILLNSVGMEWLYKGLEEYTYITVRSIVFKVIALIALFLLVRNETDTVLYGGVTILAASASNLLNLVHARKVVDVRRPEGCDWKRHLKPVLIFFAISCAATIYTNLDALMLGFMTSDADVGYYQAAVKVKGILISIVTALGVVLLPRSSWYVEHGRMEDFRRITKKAMRFVLLSAFALALYFILTARECILFISGEAFLPAEPAMQIILPTVLLVGMTNILGIQMLVPLGREKVVLWSEIAGAVTDLVLNLLLIPRWHAAGAAAGTLAAEVVVLVVQAIALKTEVKDLFREYPWVKTVAGLAIAAGAGFFGKWLATTLGGGTLVILVVSAVLFFGAYGGFLLWQKEEILMETVERVKKRIKK